MSETHSPVLVRMTNELKAKLQKSAILNGRTLTGEINSRLKESLEVGADEKPSAVGYAAGGTATVLHANEKGPASTSLSDTDKAILKVFRAMPPEKQLALLSLFK